MIDFDHRYPGLKNAPAPATPPEPLSVRCNLCGATKTVESAGLHTCECGMTQFLVEEGPKRP